ncbi:hypothetical protein J1N35_004956 [Gossypium stocksii]|uniref:Uncharacterized protein n=1 Tax=Gossypium stocksii TaxID=47602 RepID=A0A9D3WCY1_9ROSI|nr:hypothetical protein J1N35_004956 [Gossypium stocksii]
MLTEMLLDCETRQLEIVTDVPIQANLINRQKDDGHNNSKQDSSRGYSRNYNQGFKHKGGSRGTYCGRRRGGMSMVLMGNGQSVPVTNIDSSTVFTSSRALQLKNVLHDSQTWITLLVGHMHNGLYKFDAYNYWGDWLPTEVLQGRTINTNCSFGQQGVFFLDLALIIKVSSILLVMARFSSQGDDRSVGPVPGEGSSSPTNREVSCEDFSPIQNSNGQSEV